MAARIESTKGMRGEWPSPDGATERAAAPRTFPRRTMANQPHRQDQFRAITSPLPQTPGEAGSLAPTFFLRTKLLPPRPAPTLLPRPRLVERLAQNFANP